MVRETKRRKGVVVAVAAVLLVVFFAGTVFAVSANVQDVLDRLATLQSADIDPGWLPDIEKNQSSVQAMLDSYLRCTGAEKKEFTPQQNSDLHAYFEALYTVQGKDPSAVDAIFAGEVVASSSAAASSSRAVSSSRSVASSAAVSSAVSSVVSSSGSGSVTSASGSGSGSGASSSVGVAAAGVSSSAASVPPVQPVYFSPQIPQGGWVTFLGNRALGGVLLTGLGVLLAVVFLRYLAALRKAGKVPQSAWASDFRGRELYGENYAGDGLPEDVLAVGPKVKPATPRKGRLKKEKAKAKKAREATKNVPPQVPPVAEGENPWLAIAPKLAAQQAAGTAPEEDEVWDVGAGADRLLPREAGVGGRRPAGAAAPGRMVPAAGDLTADVASAPEVQTQAREAQAPMAPEAAAAPVTQEPPEEAVASPAVGLQTFAAAAPTRAATRPAVKQATRPANSPAAKRPPAADAPAQNKPAMKPEPAANIVSPPKVAAVQTGTFAMGARPQETPETELDAAPVKARVNPARPVTGRPGKMTFHPGESEDMDAIDD